MSTALVKLSEITGASSTEVTEVIKGMIISSKNQHGSVATDAEMAVVIGTCAKYGLNPLVRECASFISGGKLQVVVMVDGWAKLVNRQPSLDGIEFEEKFDEKGKIFSSTCSIYIKGRSMPVKVTEFHSECFMPSSSVWKKYPCRMLRHKSFIQAARLAFGISEIIDNDEVDRIKETQGNITAPQVEVDFDAIDKEFSECGDDETLRQTASACRENLEKLNAWESAKVQVAALRTKHKDRLEALVVSEVTADDDIIDVEFAEVDEETKGAE